MRLDVVDVAGAEALRACLDAATQTLRAQEWKVVKRQDMDDSAWHLVAKKGRKVRVIQVILPAAPADVRQERRQLLGETVRLPANLGTMEQWMAHVRPDGHLTFGPYLLNAQHWADSGMDALAALGIAA